MITSIFRLAAIIVMYVLNIVVISCTCFISYIMYIFYDKYGEIYDRLDYLCDFISYDQSSNSDENITAKLIDKSSDYSHNTQNKSILEYIKSFFYTNKHKGKNLICLEGDLSNKILMKNFILQSSSIAIYNYLVEYNMYKKIDEKTFNISLNILSSGRYCVLYNVVRDFLIKVNKCDDDLVRCLYVSLLTIIKTKRFKEHVIHLSEISKIIDEWFGVLKGGNNNIKQKIDINKNRFLIKYVEKIKYSIFISEVIDYTMHN